ncbi:unnamed protein product [Paramecium octaurelia]|uniref:Vacuolar protein sorting-associated protein 8 central domain-containing protein n=1 Tax=Paramecium octaurelia TaxID=43137 RepID=A0A8S1WT64_PAROT|nr:unnamed protein product [Paramecium octaurelia]
MYYNDQQKQDQRRVNLDLNESALRTEITPEGVFQQFYSSELDQIIQKEFQNPKYLQEISLDGTKFKYQNEQFDYSFPLQSKTLYFQPKLKDIFEFEVFPHTRPNPKCLAVQKNKIAIAYAEFLQIWNKKKEKEYILPIGEISCMDFSKDGNLLVCGQIKTILLIDSNKGILVQTFPNIHIQRIIVIRCIWKNKEEQFVTTSIDASGQSLLINFTKSIFSYSIDEWELLDTMQFPTGSMKYIQMTENRILIGINSIQFFWVVYVEIMSTKEITFKLVYEFKNPRKVRDSQIFKTSCAIGRGLVRIKDQLSRRYVMAFVWDNKLHHLVLENDRQIEMGSSIFHRSQYINVGSLVYECDFLKDSLYLLYSDKGIIIMNTLHIDMNQSEQQLSSIKHQYFDNPGYRPTGYQFRRCKTLMKKVTQQYVKLKLYNDPICNYSQQFSHQNALFNDRCVQSSMVGQGKIVKYLIQEEEWLYCMNYVLSLYLGFNEQYSEFIELNKDERYSLIKHSVEDLSLKYIKICVQLIQTNISAMQDASKYKLQELKMTNQIMLSILIEFLLKCDSYDLLFEKIMNDVNQSLRDNHQFFLYCLQPFYQQKFVKRIPVNMLNKIIEIYMNEKRLDLIQMMIQSLDHKIIKSDQLIKICLKYGLMKSLAIICFQGDMEQYLTPILKIWSVILTMIEKSQFETCIYYACRALAIMKMIFINNDALGDMMEEKKQVEIKKQLANWLLNDQTIEKLMTLQTISTFEVLLKLLEYQKKYDNSNFSRTMLIISKVISVIQAGENDFQKSFQQFHKQESFLDDLQIQFILFQVRYFISFGGHGSRIVEYLSYMLKNPQVFCWIYFTELIDSIKDDQKMQDVVLQWYYKKDIIEFLKCQYFINIAIKLEKEIQSAVLGLSYEADFTTFSMISIYFAERKKEFTRAFNFFLTSQNRFVRSLVFDWVEMRMKELQQSDQDNFNQMRSALILKISDLIQIDWNKTRIIFSNYNSESEKVVIEKLSQFPELQLQYIDNVIKRERELGNKVDANFLIINIQLLCQLNPDKIIEEVSSYDYPLEEILEPCKQYKILPAQAYILEKMGRIVESVSISCQILRQIIQKHKTELDQNYKLSMRLGGGSDEHHKLANLKILFPMGKKKKKDGQDQQDINIMKPFEDAKFAATNEIVNQIQKIVKICKNDKFEKNEEKWYTLLDQLIDIRDNLIFDSPSQNFMKHSIFTTQICHIFATIAEVSNLGSLIYQLSNRYNNLDLGQLKKAFQEIIQNYLYTQHLQSNVQFLLMNDIYEKLTVYIQKSKIGIISNRICYKNKTEQSLDGDCKVSNDDFVVFECKHNYHKKCVMMYQGVAFCNLCFKVDQTYSYKLMNSKVLEGATNLEQDDNELLKEEIENVNKFNNSSSQQNSDDVKFIPKVSEETMEKRKKRVNKLYYFDRKRNDNYNIMEDTNRDIDYCNKQNEMKRKKQEMEEKQSKLNKKRK